MINWKKKMLSLIKAGLQLVGYFLNNIFITVSYFFLTHIHSKLMFSFNLGKFHLLKKRQKLWYYNFFRGDEDIPFPVFLDSKSEFLLRWIKTSI